MVKLLSSVTLILAIFLFPPASLALVSNNAVPGDVTYPIKRGLEDVIYAIASLNPITRAWFSAARSDRRFKEFSTLVAQGKSASDTLDELVVQTQVAAEQLKKVEDPVRKEQLADQLLNSIKKYDQGLEQVSNQITPKPPPAATVAPAQPKPSPTPASTPVSTPRPTPSIQPATPPQPPQGGADATDIEDARKKIEEIEKKIREEKEKSKKEKEHSDKKEQREVKKEKDKEDKNDDDSERKERRDRKKD